MPRNRDARLAVLGSPVPRSRPAGLSSRSATALRRRIVAGLLVFLSIVLITIYFREPSNGGLHGVQSAGATVLRPFEVGAERIAQPFRDAYGWFAGLVHAKSENSRLRAEVDKYSQLAIQNESAAQQNADLKRQLHYVGSREFPRDYDYVATDIISRPPSEFDQQRHGRGGLDVRDPLRGPGGERRRPHRARHEGRPRHRAGDPADRPEGEGLGDRPRHPGAGHRRSGPGLGAR